MLGLRPDGKFACFEYAEIVSRQNGKGSILEARVLAGLFILGENLIMWSAHEMKTAMEAFRRLRALLINLGELINENLIDIDGIQIKINNTNGSEGFERLDTGQRVKFIARSKGSGRGFSGDVNIIDETFAYTDDQHSALMPTMSARPNPQIIYTSSPPLKGDAGPVLFRLRTRSESGTSNRLGFRDWGMDGELDSLKAELLDDPAVWRKCNPAYGIRIDEEFVQSERESMSDESFAIERLGIWPRQISGGGAIDMERWRKLADPSSKRDGDVAIAVDIAPSRDYAAITVYGLRSDGLGHVVMQRYQPGTDWLVDAIVEARDALDPVAIGMGVSTAASLEVELKKHKIDRPEDVEKPKRGELAVAASREMTAAVGHFLDAVRDGTFRHLGQQELTNSAAGAKARKTADALVWALKESAADTSPLVAATLAKWAFESRVHLVDQEEELEPWAVFV